MESICVYLGSNLGNHSAFKIAVIQLAQEIVNYKLTLIYGGSSLGMMGLLASTVKELGGKVIGITTSHLLSKEIPLNTLDKLYIVDNMQERKKMLIQLADGFIVLPGGLGTLEEAMETWNSIKTGELNKKIAFLNINHYFNNLFTFMRNCQENGFISPEQYSIPIVHTELKILFEDLFQM